jgi:predicted acetyltransferase
VPGWVLSTFVPEPVDIRFIEAGELDAFVECDAAGFATDVRPESYEFARHFLEVDRCIAAVDRKKLVGQGAALSWEMALPGGASVGAAAVTYVSVLGTHHRRGVLTRMMGALLDQAADRGEPCAILLASESLIYGRFGYGVTTSAASWEIDRRYATLREPIDIGGEFAFLDAVEAEVAAPALWEQVWRRQPGEVSRSEGWWWGWFSDPEHWRGGATHRFYVAHRDDNGVVDGLAGFRYKEQWESNPHHALTVSPIIATSPAVRLAMQAWLCKLDLVGTVKFEWAPRHEPFRWALKEPRRLRQTELSDALWLRVLDVPAVLGARTYRPTDALVLDVHDPFRPAVGGRFLLDAGAGGAQCTRTDRDADVALGIEELGVIALGGERPSTLAAAGRVEASADALARADALFATDVPAYCATDF